MFGISIQDAYRIGKGFCYYFPQGADTETQYVEYKMDGIA